MWISEIFYNCFLRHSRCGAYPRLSTRPVAMPGSRVLPALRGPSRGASRAPRRRNNYPEGVGKTTSGKYYSRIVLDGKRYNLGSTFITPEEASTAYEVAKRDGVTHRPSPKKNQNSRGTGMPLHHPPRCCCFGALLHYVIDRATLRFAGVKAQKAAQVPSSKATPTTFPSTHFSITGQRHLLAERLPLASLPVALAFPFPQSLQVPAPMPVMVGGGSHSQLGQLATRAVREQRAPAPVIARVVHAP